MKFRISRRKGGHTKDIRKDIEEGIREAAYALVGPHMIDEDYDGNAVDCCKSCSECYCEIEWNLK